MSTDDWLAPFREAHQAPERVAERWRSGGGLVVGIFGDSAPRELVTAAGMLAVRLDPLRLGRGAESGSEGAPAGVRPLPAGLGTDLAGGPLDLLASLFSGELAWLDGLLIGRDSEAHTKLFYLIREMAGDPEFTGLIPRFAFSDVLRLPRRSSAAYNRVRLHQLATELAGWAGREVEASALTAAIEADEATRRELRGLRALQDRGLLTARDRLVAERGAQVLPAETAQAALRAAVSSIAGRPPIPSAAPRVFLTGSEPQPDVVGELEALGLHVAGDDHDWAAPGLIVDPQTKVGAAPESIVDPQTKAGAAPIFDSQTSAATGDPIDRLADHYQLHAPGPARAGLDRVSRSVGRVRELDADAVLQLVLPEDEASGWELPELRRLLPDLPVVSVTPDGSGEAFGRAAAALLAAGRRPSAADRASAGVLGAGVPHA